MATIPSWGYFRYVWSLAFDPLRHVIVFSPKAAKPITRTLRLGHHLSHISSQLSIQVAHLTRGFSVFRPRQKKTPGGSDAVLKEKSFFVKKKKCRLTKLQIGFEVKCQVVSMTFKRFQVKVQCYQRLLFCCEFIFHLSLSFSWWFAKIMSWDHPKTKTNKNHMPSSTANKGLLAFLIFFMRIACTGQPTSVCRTMQTQKTTWLWDQTKGITFLGMVTHLTWRPALGVHPTRKGLDSHPFLPGRLSLQPPAATKLFISAWSWGTKRKHGVFWQSDSCTQAGNFQLCKFFVIL